MREDERRWEKMGEDGRERERERCPLSMCQLVSSLSVCPSVHLYGKPGLRSGVNANPNSLLKLNIIQELECWSCGLTCLVFS